MKASVIMAATILFSGISLNGLAQKTKNTKEEKAPAKSIVTILEKTPETSEFYGYMKRDNVTTAINAEKAKTYTIFAPANLVFGKGLAADSAVMANTVTDVPANWTEGFIVEGTLDLNAIIEQIRNNNWKAQITTKTGNTLWATVENGKVKLSDDKGNSARIIRYNLVGSNGVVHVIDGNLLAKQ